MKAVRFDHYGDIEVLDVVDVPEPEPEPGDGEVLVRVKAAGVNPGEALVRTGVLHDRFPASFPSGQGSDFAGIVERTGGGVADWRAGDEVIGFTNNRASHAELVAVDASNLTRRPSAVPWDAAGALYVAGATAWAAVRAVGASAGDVVVISGAAGGVGCIAVQLARNAGATVIGLASEPHHPEAAARHGVKTAGNAEGASASVLAELAQLIAEARLEIPIARTYALGDVRDACREVEQRHTIGKIVLHPSTPDPVPTVRGSHSPLARSPHHASYRRPVPTRERGPK